MLYIYTGVYIVIKYIRRKQLGTLESVPVKRKGKKGGFLMTFGTNSLFANEFIGLVIMIVFCFICLFSDTCFGGCQP